MFVQSIKIHVVDFCDVETGLMSQKYSTQMNSPSGTLSNINFKIHPVKFQCCRSLAEQFLLTNAVQHAKQEARFNLLFSFYRNVLVKGLREMLSMPESNKYDMPLCCKTVDLDFDGQVEVLLGTYGQVGEYIFTFTICIHQLYQWMMQYMYIVIYV